MDAPGQDEANASGPAVWLDMDQQAQDGAHDQYKYALNRPQIVERYTSNRNIARERLGVPRRIAGELWSVRRGLGVGDAADRHDGRLVASATR
jgi:hypothetical protein